MQVIYDMHERDYHAHEAVGSHSLMTLIEKTPKHYYYEKYLGQQKQETDSLRKGRLGHMATLELERFRKSSITLPPFTGTGSKTKKVANGGCKEEWDAYKKYCESVTEALQDDEFITERRDKAELLLMSRAVRNSGLGAIFKSKDIKAEVSAFWQDEQTGIDLKCRFDSIVTSKNLIVEYKTCYSASPQEFQKAVSKWHYDLQAVHYMEGYKAAFDITPKYVWVAQETTPPYAVAFYTPSNDHIENGLHKRRVALERLKECLDSGRWPAYTARVQELELVPWGWFTEGL